MTGEVGAEVTGEVTGEVGADVTAMCIRRGEGGCGAGERPVLDVQRDGAVLVVALDRPPANGLDEPLLRALWHELRRAAAGPGVRAVVLTSRVAGAFSTGLDLDAIRAAPGHRGPARQTVRLTNLVRSLARAIERCPAPVVAALPGATVGSALTIALACDLRVASELASFWLPDALYGGFLGDSGAGRLARLVGPAASGELLYTGARITAERARQIGLVDHLAPRAAVLQAALDIARTIAARAPLTVAFSKRAVRGALRGPCGQQRFEARLLRRAASSADAAEGLAAQAEGRPPRFRGR